MATVSVKLQAQGLSEFRSALRSAGQEVTNFRTRVTGASRISQNAFNQINQSARQLNSGGFRQAAQGIDQVGQSAQRLGGQAAQVRTLGSAFSSIGSSISGLSLAAAGPIAGIGAAVGGYLALNDAIEELDIAAAAAQQTFNTLDFAAGGANEARLAIASIQEVTQGTASQLEAAGLAGTLLNLELAKTPQEVAKFTRATEAVKALSPVINDTEGAIGQLTLTLANQSVQRLDQLGLSVATVRDRQRELQAANADLSKEQAFNEAVVGLLAGRYDDLVDSGSIVVSQAAQARAAFADLTTEFQLFVAEVGRSSGIFDLFLSTSGVENLTSVFRQLRGETNLGDALGIASGRREDFEATQGSRAFGVFAPTDNSAVINSLQEFESAIAVLQQRLDEGNPAAAQFEADFIRIAEIIADTGNVTPELAAEITALNIEMQTTTSALATGIEASRNLSAETLASASAFDQARFAIGGLAEASQNVAATIAGAIGDVNSSIGSLAGSVVSAGLGVSGVVGSTEAQSLTENALAQLQSAASGIQAQVNAGNLSPLAGQFRLQEVENQVTEQFRAINENEQERKRLIKEQESDQKRLASEQERLAEQSAAAWTRAAENTQKAFTSALEKIPGLFGSSDVTQEQLDLADAGVPQEFADDFLRQARDALLNGVDREGVNREDIEQRLASSGGLSIEQLRGLPAELLVGQLEQAWNSGSLFSDVANLDLINLDAARDALGQQATEASGQANLTQFLTDQLGEVFGIDERQLTAFQQSGAGVGAAIAEGAASETALQSANQSGLNLASSFAAGLTGQDEGGGDAEDRTPIPTLGGLELEGFDELAANFVVSFGDALGASELQDAYQAGARVLLENLTGAFGRAQQQTDTGPTDETKSDDIEGIAGQLTGIFEKPLQEFADALTTTGEAAENMASAMLETEGAVKGFTGFLEILGNDGGALPQFADAVGKATEKLKDLANTGNGGNNDPSPAPPVPGAARGLRFFPGGTFLGGEEGPELLITPRGGLGLIGANGPQLFTAPVGSQVIDAQKTARAFSSGRVAPPQTRVTNNSNVVSNSSSTTNQNFNLSVNALRSTGSVVNDFSLMRTLGR